MLCSEAKECGVPNQLQTYFRDINQVSLLSPGEERELAVAIASGDGDARGRLIQANLRLVVKIARDYLGRGMVLDDLIGEGNLGLIRAAEEYDPRFGTRFSTYASYWIKQSIRHALINTTATIRLHAHMYGLLTKWRRVERALSRERGCLPSFEDVATQLGLTDTQKGLVAKAHRARQLKLESCLGDEQGSWSADESDHTGQHMEQALEFGDDRQELARRMERLEDRERLVLTLRYGLGGENPHTLKEIGLRLGVTREWVRKLELKAIARLASAQEPSTIHEFEPRSRAHANRRTSISRSTTDRKPRRGSPRDDSRVENSGLPFPSKSPLKSRSRTGLTMTAAC
jgi:RNA polymerase primary sigma factor